MRYLKTYESMRSNKSFLEILEYINDICLDLKDDGFNVDVKRESYWKSDNKNIKNRFSPSHQHEKNSVKLLMIKVVIYKLDADSPAYPYSPSGNTEDIMYEIDNDIFDYENWVSGYSTWLYHTKKYGTTREIDPISLQLTFSK